MADYLRVPIINSNHEILMKRQSSKVPVQIRDLIEPEITIFMLNLPFPSDFQSLTLFFQSIDSQLKITKCYSIKNHELKSIHESPAFIPVGSFLFVQFETPRDLDLIFNSDLSNVEWNLPKNLGIQSIYSAF